MDLLDFKDEDNKPHLEFIISVLNEKKLKPDIGCEWEIHGPQWPDLPYQVYVGIAKPLKLNQRCSLCNKTWSKCDEHANFTIVAIHKMLDDTIVYEIEDAADWGKVKEENKI